MAQVVSAVREEMALTLEDVVMRRTWLGQFGPPRNLAKVADIMGAMLGWDEQPPLARNGKPGAALPDTGGRMTAFVVVNPKSANGRTGRDWPKIKPALEKLFPLMQVAQSHARGETARLVRAALKDGHLDIIAVGGDGTINEAVNGFFENGVPVSPDAVFGFVSSGTGGDFRRTFGIEPGL